MFVRPVNIPITTAAENPYNPKQASYVPSYGQVMFTR